MKYDVAIIGAGPAGMMAAISAAQNGARVVIIEKNNRPGIKLLLAGNGRCNLMNKATDEKTFVSALGSTGKFMFSSLNQFGLEDTWNFFEALGIPLKVEENNKVFPKSNKGQDVLNALIKELKKINVELLFNSTVRK